MCFSQRVSGRRSVVVAIGVDASFTSGATEYVAIAALPFVLRACTNRELCVVWLQARSAGVGHVASGLSLFALVAATLCPRCPAGRAGYRRWRTAPFLALAVVSAVF